MISQKTGRVLSAVGALLLIAGLFLTWYHIDRTQGTTDTTGWQTFTRLRVVILLGAGLLLVSAVVRQVRYVLIARTVLGLVLAALILRRIIDPPDIGAPISAQIGVAVGLVGAVAAALGGLVDSGREVIERYPDLSFGRRAAAQLGSGEDAEPARRTQPLPQKQPPQRAYVDSSAEEI